MKTKTKVGGIGYWYLDHNKRYIAVVMAVVPNDLGDSIKIVYSDASYDWIYASEFEICNCLGPKEMAEVNRLVSNWKNTR